MPSVLSWEYLRPMTLAYMRAVQVLNAKSANNEVKRAKETASLQIAILRKYDAVFRTLTPGFGYATALHNTDRYSSESVHVCTVMCR